MENKIEIKPTTSLEELTEIFTNNEREDVIKAVHVYMRKQTNDWYDQYDRANNAEAELKRINAILSKAYLDQIENK